MQRIYYNFRMGIFLCFIFSQRSHDCNAHRKWNLRAWKHRKLFCASCSNSRTETDLFSENNFAIILCRDQVAIFWSCARILPYLLCRVSGRCDFLVAIGRLVVLVGREIAFDIRVARGLSRRRERTNRMKRPEYRREGWAQREERRGKMGEEGARQ